MVLYNTTITLTKKTQLPALARTLLIYPFPLRKKLLIVTVTIFKEYLIVTVTIFKNYLIVTIDFSGRGFNSIWC